VYVRAVLSSLPRVIFVAAVAFFPVLSSSFGYALQHELL
jgi:hypothetical protein